MLVRAGNKSCPGTKIISVSQKLSERDAGIIIKVAGLLIKIAGIKVAGIKSAISLVAYPTTAEKKSELALI